MQVVVVVVLGRPGNTCVCSYAAIMAQTTHTHTHDTHAPRRRKEKAIFDKKLKEDPTHAITGTFWKEAAARVI
jgi:hypothetical protein